MAKRQRPPKSMDAAASAEEPRASPPGDVPEEEELTVEPGSQRVNVRIDPKAAGSAPPSRRPLLVGGVIAGVVVVVVVVGLVVWGSRGSPPATNTAAPSAAADGATAARLLDGTPVDPAGAARWPIAIMFDNHPAARPPSGLSLARVVYETLAEGGTTRFMALYDGSENPDRFGPVRSSRHYFVHLAEEYHAAYVHAGGSPQSIAALKASTVTDLNLIGSGSKYGFRDKSRPAPHNLYTDDKLLTFALRDKKLVQQPATFTSWRFEPEPGLLDRPTESLSVSLPFPGKDYQVEWRYQRGQNEFERLEASQPHLDAIDQRPIRAKTVVILSLPAEKPLGEKGRIDVTVTGEGKAQILMDGTVIEGRWSRPTLKDRTRFTDASGAEIAFHPGPIWLELLPGNREITVTRGTAE